MPKIFDNNPWIKATGCLDIVSYILPLLGPYGLIAGSVVSLISSIFGVIA